MSLLSVILALVALGVLMWLIERFVPMSASISKYLYPLIAVAVVLWLLNIFGVLALLKEAVNIPVTPIK